MVHEVATIAADIDYTKESFLVITWLKKNQDFYSLCKHIPDFTYFKFTELSNDKLIKELTYTINKIANKWKLD